MAPARTTHKADCNWAVRRYLRALLLLAIVSLLISCGSGGGTQAPGGGGSTNSNTTTLTWDAVTDPSLTGYRIYYGTASGTYFQRLDVGNVITYTVTGLSSGTTYYFAATSIDTSGNESVFSNEVFKAIR